MRIGGIEVNGPNEMILVLPRGENQIVFKARAILDYDEFYKLCPEPVPPSRLTKDGQQVDLSDKHYLDNKVEHERRKLAWIVLKTLEPSDIEWTTVKMNSPGTWANYSEDLKNAGFSVVEINRIVDLVLECNCLDESKLKWAREVFVQGQQKSQQL